MMPTILRHETMPIRSESDVVAVRQAVRRWAVELTFSTVDQTKMMTAASELARNTWVYGGGGTVKLESLVNGTRKGLRLTFEDEGRGIPDV
jgi:serine/threonine-protein kinase RsbT